MARRVLGLFAKAPIAGEVKTRLTPPLSREDAAALYEAMLFDIVATGNHFVFDAAAGGLVTVVSLWAAARLERA